MLDRKAVDVGELLRSVIVPVISQLTRPGEVDRVTLTWADQHGPDQLMRHPDKGLFVELVIAGETAILPIWVPGEPELSHSELRARLASDLQDFVAESRFGWGQLRTHQF